MTAPEIAPPDSPEPDPDGGALDARPTGADPANVEGHPQKKEPSATTPRVFALPGRAVFSRLRAQAQAHAPTLNGLASILVGVIFYFGVNHFTRFKNVIEFDPDEGNNVIKTLLLSRGHRFLDEIWSDQPPLFAHLLRVVFDLTSWKTENGRMFDLFFGAVVVTVLYDLLRRQYGHLIALTGVGLLLLTKFFVPLSVCVMIGLPSIAFACVGVWALARWHERGRWWLLAASGAMFALSVGTKMFTAFLPPIFGLMLLAWSWERRRDVRRVAIDAAVWGGSLCVVLAACLWPVLRAGDPFRVYRAHDIARTTDAIGGFLGQTMVVQFLEQDVAIFALAAAGIFIAATRRHAATSLLAAWLVFAGTALYLHTPVWEHHRLLITIPAAFLAAVALGELTLAFQGAARRPGVPAAVLGPLVLGTILFASPERVRHLKTPPGWSDDESDVELLEKLTPYRGKTKYMLTARQMYAFRLGLEVPPSLAVTSLKRFRTGLLNSDTIIDTLNEFDPGIVVITTRWSKPVRNKVRRALEQDYIQIYEDRKNQSLEAFVRREIAIPRDVLTDG